MIYSDIELDMMTIEDWESIEADAMNEAMRMLESTDYEDAYYSETDIYGLTEDAIHSPNESYGLE